jgi:hypothetical protein
LLLVFVWDFLYFLSKSVLVVLAGAELWAVTGSNASISIMSNHHLIIP